MVEIDRQIRITYVSFEPLCAPGNTTHPAFERFLVSALGIRYMMHEPNKYSFVLHFGNNTLPKHAFESSYRMCKSFLRKDSLKIPVDL